MKAPRLIIRYVLVILAMTIVVPTAFAGTATASDTASGGELHGDITKAKRAKTGVLTVKKVTVTDKFGHEKVLKDGTDYTVKGNKSSSPTIDFTDPLDPHDHVYVELTTAKRGDFGYQSLVLY